MAFHAGFEGGKRTVIRAAIEAERVVGDDDDLEGGAVVRRILEAVIEVSFELVGALCLSG